MKVAVGYLAPLLAVSSLLFASLSHAGEAEIRRALKPILSPGVVISSVKPTPYQGLYEVNLGGRKLLYMDAKGQFLFDGEITDLKKSVNVTKDRMMQLQAIKWDSLPFENAIKTVKGNGARKLVVFSDVDCPYCRKFEVELNKVDNTTVYTFLRPVAELHPQAVQTSRQIWCAPNRNQAWDAYITQGKVPKNDGQCTNPVAATMALAEKLNIFGTPTLVFPNGQRVPGMVPAEQLEKLLAAGAK